jgi:excisionase family DNA binding protein
MSKSKIGSPSNRPTLNPGQAAAHGVRVPEEPADAVRYLSPNEIAKIMSVTGECVKQWIYNRRIPAMKQANGYWKIKVSDLEQFLKDRTQLGKRAILITDSPAGSMREVIETVRGLEHQAIVAANFADTLLKALDHHPALFVINVDSQDSDPWKLCQKIRATKALRKASILLVGTVDLTEAQAEQALKLEAKGFIKLTSGKETISSEIQRVTRMA